MSTTFTNRLLCHALLWGAFQARLLLKMCYDTGKATFCAGAGGQLLAYVAATGGKDLTVVNGNGRGGNLDYISSCPIPELDGACVHPCETCMVGV